MREGLLFVGTEFGLFMSMDDGESWRPLQQNLPRSPVTDLAIQERWGDLAVATQGRSFWVLDDLSLLRELSWLSRRMNMEMIISASMRSLSSSVRPTPRSTVSLSLRMAPWGRAAISWASSCARASALPFGTISFTRPMRSASRTSIRRPVMMSSMAREKPTTSGKPRREPVPADDVPAPLQRAELRVLRGDADVREQGRLEARGEGMAVHGGDDGLEDVDLARVATGAGKVVEVAPVLVEVAELFELGGILQVPPGAEGASPRRP